MENLKTKNTVKKAKISKRLAKKIEKVENFDSKNAGSWDRLMHVANLAEIDTFSLSKVVKTFLEASKKAGVGLTPAQKKVLTFNNVKDYVNKSDKYSHLTHFSFHQVKLICNAVIKANDLNTKRAAKVKKQGGTVGKKADKIVGRGNSLVNLNA